MAIIDLGLSADQFWSLTPAQFEALTLAKRSSSRKEDLRFGLICSVIASVVGNKIDPIDFFPEHKKKSKPRLAKEGAAHQRRVTWDRFVDWQRAKKLEAERHGG